MPVTGWYQDPNGEPGRFRFWDGTAWSEVTTLDPANTPWPSATGSASAAAPAAPESAPTTPLASAPAEPQTATPWVAPTPTPSPVEPQPQTATPWGAASATPGVQPQAQAVPPWSPQAAAPAWQPQQSQQPGPWGQAPQAPQGYGQPAPGYGVPGTPAPKKGAPIGLIVTAIVVVVALIGAAVWFFKLRGTDDAGTTTATNVPSIPGNNLSAPGSIIGWGENDFYQITTGVSSDEAVGPTAIPGTDDAVRIAAGSAANYFIKADGTLWGWGGYVASQNATAKTPIQIGSWTNVADVAAFKDSDTILVLLTDGSVYAMGDNEYGEVGTGSPTNSAIYTPNKVGVTNVIAVAAGGSTGYALDSSGAVWAWGENTYGQLGVGNTRESFAVAQVSGLPQIAAIGAGRKSGYAIDTTGALWGWGSNGSGQLGLGNNSDQATPVKTEINNAVFVDCGDDTAYVIRSDGSLWATGHGTYGELGNGIRKNSNVFVPSLITHCIHVSQLWGSTAAIDGSGNVYVFGNNWDGRLGIGSTEDDIAEPTKNGVTGATQVAAGWWHLIALTVK